MRKILVIGSSGAGKSTFSLRLSEILDIEIIHLDKEHWRAGWVEPPKDVWRRRVEDLIGGEAWIMDGNFSGTLDVRMAACDTVIFLDLPRLLCVWRVLKRVATYKGTHRPDMAEGCHEKLDLTFLLWIWNYPSRTRPKVLRLIEEHSQSKRVVHLRSRAAVEKFLAEEAERKQVEDDRVSQLTRRGTNTTSPEGTEEGSQWRARSAQPLEGSNKNSEAL